jgi:hypothetical protein
MKEFASRELAMFALDDELPLVELVSAEPIP